MFNYSPSFTLIVSGLDKCLSISEKLCMLVCSDSFFFLVPSRAVFSKA